ncbi:MAG TPA: SDR family oxidoreductase [Acidimicrobiia bacterium]|nr:SDR family oxidoreductase [Acidimicrobiia bacterium]
MSVLEGQVAVVTGAGQGIGRGVALALAGEGARVAVLGRTLAKCDAVVAEIEARGGDAVALQCDVEHRDQVAASVEQTVARWERIDILVNSAHSKVYRSVRSVTEDEMDMMWQSGPMATLRFMQECLPHLRAAPGAS